MPVWFYNKELKDYGWIECVCLEANRAMNRDDGSAGAGASEGGKRKVAGERYGGQRNGILQSSLGAWVMNHDVQLCFIRPGRPVENGFIESFNGRLETNV